jgi:predicted RNA-binding Zn ribbon-like protein
MGHSTPSRPTGQWFTSGDGSRWWFDSGALALDFAYTGGMSDRAEWEQLHSPDDLATWLESRFDEVEGTVTEGDLRDAIALRGAIGRAALAASRGSAPSAADIDAINLYAAIPDIPPILPGGTRQAGRATARTAQALSVLARQSVELFSEGNGERIRECSADDCQIVFFDESRSNNRRWCSMAHCGNRAKVRKHRALKGTS